MQRCCHLLGKGLPLGALVCDVLLRFCHLPMWCPVPGVVLIVSIFDFCHLTYLYYLLEVMLLLLFFAISPRCNQWIGLLCVIVAFCGHTHLLFASEIARHFNLMYEV